MLRYFFPKLMNKAPNAIQEMVLNTNLEKKNLG